MVCMSSEWSGLALSRDPTVDTAAAPAEEATSDETPGGEAGDPSLNGSGAASSSSDTRQLGHLNPRRLISIVPKPLRHAFTGFLSLIIIIYFLIPALLHTRKSLSLLGHISFLWVIAGIGFEAFALYAYACLTRTLTPPDGPGLWTLVRIDMSTLAVSRILPGGTAPGTSLGYRLMTSAGMSGPDSGFALASQGIGSAVVLNVLLWLSLVISIPLAGTQPGYVAVALVSVLLLAFFAGLIYLLTKGEDIAARVLRAAVRPIPRVSPDAVEAVVRRIGARLRVLGRDREMLRKAVVWAAANWIFDAAALWAFVAAFGNYMNPVYLFVAYGVGNVLAAIPLTPGGVGLVEAAVPALLAGFGLRHPEGVAYIAVIGWRLVSFWLPIPIGAVMYISLRVERQRVRHLVGREGLAQLRTIPEMASPVTVPVPVVGDAVTTSAGATSPIPAGDKIGGPATAAAPPGEQPAPADLDELAEEVRPLVETKWWRLSRQPARPASPERIATEIAASEAARTRLRDTWRRSERPALPSTGRPAAALPAPAAPALPERAGEGRPDGTPRTAGGGGGSEGDGSPFSSGETGPGSDQL
jgi:uncharacterized protein (TIRG00374 family)